MYFHVIYFAFRPGGRSVAIFGQLAPKLHQFVGYFLVMDWVHEIVHWPLRYNDWPINVELGVDIASRRVTATH